MSYSEDYERITRLVLTQNNFQYTQLIDEIVDYGIREFERLNDEIQDLDTDISYLNQQIEALEAVLEICKKSLSYYLETEKVKKFSNLGSCPVLYGPQYGVTNLRDWSIVAPDMSPLYQYEGYGWDYDQSIENWIKDFDFIYDFIHKPLDLRGGYGLKDTMEKLLVARSSLDLDREKFRDITRLLYYGT